jgi:hypothetical protein
MNVHWHSSPGVVIILVMPKACGSATGSPKYAPSFGHISDLHKGKLTVWYTIVHFFNARHGLSCTQLTSAQAEALPIIRQLAHM